jgi:hypothetical protein
VSMPDVEVQVAARDSGPSTGNKNPKMPT